MDMLRDSRNINVKQFCKLRLSKPDCILVKAYLKACTAIWTLIKDDFIRGLACHGKLREFVQKMQQLNLAQIQASRSGLQIYCQQQLVLKVFM